MQHLPHQRRPPDRWIHLELKFAAPLIVKVHAEQACAHEQDHHNLHDEERPETRIHELKDERAELNDRLDDLRNASDDDWDEVRDDINSRLDDLDDRIEEF